jgi:hypothetical protein
MPPNSYICPVCHQDSMVHKVSAIVNQGTSKHQIELSGDQQPKPEKYTGTSDEQTEFAKKLDLPLLEKQKLLEWKWKALIGWPILKDVVKWNVLKVRLRKFLSPWWKVFFYPVLICCILVGVFFASLYEDSSHPRILLIYGGISFGVLVILSIMIWPIVRFIKKVDAMLEARKECWQSLCYCFRDDTVFMPATGQHFPIDDWQKLLDDQ